MKIGLIIRWLIYAWAWNAGGAYLIASESDFKNVRQFLSEFCFACHGEQIQEGNVRLDQLDGVRLSSKDLELLEKVTEELALRRMPPEGERRPGLERSEETLAWLENRVAAAGSKKVSAREKLMLPEYGNYVDHEGLFTMPTDRRAATMARLWRLDVDSWVARARRWTMDASLFRDGRSNAKPVSFPYRGPDHAFLDFANIHGFDASTTEMLLLETDLVTKAFMERRWPNLLRIHGQDRAKALSAAFEVIFDRPATADELGKLPSDEDISLSIQAMLLRPEILFRVEVGEEESDALGRHHLTVSETATALGFAVDVAGPDSNMIAALSQENRHRDRRFLESLLTDYLQAAPMRDRLLRFAREYFEYPRAAEVFKDADMYDYQPLWLVEDADQFILRILDEDRDVLRQWLTSPRFYTRGMFNYTGGRAAPIRRHNGYRDYHRIYNLKEESVGKYGEWREMPSEERAGILTHPAWLLAFSDNEKNQAIQRGRWVTTKLLGGSVPDAPVEVDARLPEDKHLTLRDKMKVTRAQECLSCHRHMDPVGLPFEQYDLFGTFRFTELDRPVVTTGEWNERTIANPIHFVREMAEDRKVLQVFLRHLFRFFTGRNETLTDAPTLIDMEQAYQRSQGSLRATVLSLLTSDSFLFRTR